MTNAYIAEQCPGTEPQIVLIQGSQNRAAALLAGEIDATPVELADAIQLAHEAPGQLHTLTNFRSDLPDLRTTGIHFNRDFAATHPEVVRDYLRALLTVHRQLNADHAVLAAEAARRLDLDPETLDAITEAYFEINAWDSNGGLTETNAQYTLRFFQSTGDLDAALTLANVADLSFLEAVLGEIGRE
jgi:NitT/TauT family transport system substrate-binding protein